MSSPARLHSVSLTFVQTGPSCKVKCERCLQEGLVVFCARFKKTKKNKKTKTPQWNRSFSSSFWGNTGTVICKIWGAEQACMWLRCAVVTVIFSVHNVPIHEAASVQRSLTFNTLFHTNLSTFPLADDYVCVCVCVCSTDPDLTSNSESGRRNVCDGVSKNPRIY